MPIYEFQSEDGVVIDEWFSASDAPRVGEVIERDGVKYTRIYSTSTYGRVENDGYHVARSLPRWTPKHPGEKCPYPRVNERGQPMFANKKEIREFEARSGGVYKYDQ